MKTNGPSIDDLKDKYIRAIFVDTADEDYVLARFLFLNRLHRQFWWAAAQAVEKYLKASLVLNGVPVTILSSISQLRQSGRFIIDGIVAITNSTIWVINDQPIFSHFTERAAFPRFSWRLL